MNAGRAILAVAVLLGASAAFGDEREPDPERDVLVTLEVSGAAPVSGGIGAPYRKRKRYAMSVDVQLRAVEIARDYELLEIVRWPIRSLSVLCIVFRGADAEARDELVARLRADPRIESAQQLNRFDTRLSSGGEYDDTFAGLQRSLAAMSVPAAHRYSRGRGIRVAVVDSAADVRHEDLTGRVSTIHDFTDARHARDTEHGTAVASIIGASANNARGIVGVAPEAEIELYVACWSDEASSQAVCDSLSLARALDAVSTGNANVVNLSLSGPHDPLLERLLEEILKGGAVVVASHPGVVSDGTRFPASLDGVIAVTGGDTATGARPVSSLRPQSLDDLYAPAEKIVVALPRDEYDFRSGSSLAAAHASGVVALLLSAAPTLTRDAVADYLHASQQHSQAGTRSINACAALRLADRKTICR